ncbi:MAG TPA: SDR family oxidoreductase [Balneolaceae bacterium]
MNISILGCGWLGFPLARHLIAQSHSVKGSTTSPEKLEMLRKNDIRPFLIKLSPELKNADGVHEFWNADVLVLNIPPGRRRENVLGFHTAQIRSISKAIADSPIELVIFVSSTSVYPNKPGVVIESDAVPGKAGRESGNALLEAEHILSQNTSFETTVIRFGGLIGYDRHPVKYLAGKKELERGKAPVNLIHRDDCIKIITQIINDNITGEVFNAVSDDHSTRKQYYSEAAKTLGLEPPKFRKDESSSYKIVSNEKLKLRLDYEFKKEENSANS